MTDIPIMFSAPMILGLDREATEQGTGKSMTSRMAWRPDGFTKLGTARIGAPTPWQRVQVGDRLWVRENFWQYGRWAVKTRGAKFGYIFNPVAFPGGNVVHAAAQPIFLNDQQKGKFAQSEPAWHLRPNIFLPRAESRFTLVITGTKIRRLQAITEVECEREGLRWDRVAKLWTCPAPDGGDWHSTKDAKECFRWLWTKLHGAGAWEENPEIVALTFTVHKQNIDTLQVAA